MSASSWKFFSGGGIRIAAELEATLRCVNSPLGIYFFLFIFFSFFCRLKSVPLKGITTHSNVRVGKNYIRTGGGGAPHGHCARLLTAAALSTRRGDLLTGAARPLVSRSPHPLTPSGELP